MYITHGSSTYTLTAVQLCMAAGTKPAQHDTSCTRALVACVECSQPCAEHTVRSTMLLLLLLITWSGWQTSVLACENNTPVHPQPAPTQCFVLSAATNETPGLPNNMTQAHRY